MTGVQLGAWDWVFLVWFVGVSLGVGLYYARRAGKSLSEYFLSGRNLPWWALGTSMVATTFAADTPIAVAGWVISDGISKNWIWWSFLFGGTLTVFVFSRLWRRAAVFTEIELITRRYEGKPASVLRGFKAVYLGLIANAIVFGWVMKAMSTIMGVVFGTDPWVSAAILLAITLVYTTLSGLWGVVATDVLQFVMALVGAVLLAVLAVSEVGGLGALVDRVGALTAAGGPDVLSIVPTGWDAFTYSILAVILINWWAVYYPGAEPGGGGYVAQRMLAARDEYHARAGTMWFIFAHYVLRPWPWILVGLCAIALRPEFLQYPTWDAATQQANADLNPENAYPWMFHLLPVGLLGLVVASFFAAFMSTMTTTLNLSASYLVNDLYLPFLGGNRLDERWRVRVARLTVVIVMAFGCVATAVMATVGDGWTFLMELTGGTGLVLILRWLWWRVNAWSEISAMIASAAVCLFCYLGPGNAMLADRLGAGSPLIATFRLLGIVGITTAVWIIVTLRTRPVPRDHLVAFYRQVRPGGAWGPIAAASELEATPLTRDMVLWVSSTAMVFGALLGFGSALLLDWAVATPCLILATLGGITTAALMRRT